jgi:hypothetical protein
VDLSHPFGHHKPSDRFLHRAAYGEQAVVAQDAEFLVAERMGRWGRIFTFDILYHATRPVVSMLFLTFAGSAFSALRKSAVVCRLIPNSADVLKKSPAGSP